MELVWLTLRARFRRSWLPSVAIAMLIGVVGGFVFAAAAAARHVGGAYQSLLSEIDAPDLLVFPGCGSDFSAITGCTGPPGELDPALVTEQLSRLEDVEQVRSTGDVRPYLIAADGTPLLATAGNPTGCFDGDRSVNLIALRDGGPRAQPLPFRLVGDLPQGDPSGVVLTRATAARVGVGIGDGFAVAGWCTGNGDVVGLSEPIDLVVTGLSIGAFDVEPPGVGFTIEPTYVDASVLDALYAVGAERSVANAVWLVDGSAAAETRELEGYDSLIDLEEQAANIEQALDADAGPLWLLAAAGALTGMLLLAPIIDRSIRDDTDEVATLVALGSTRSQTALRAVSHIVVVTAAGLLIAIVVSPLIAALLPMGLGGDIAGDGIWFDATVTGLGIVGLLAVVAGIAGLSTWRSVTGTRTAVPVTELTTDRAIGALRLRPAAQTGVMGAVGRPAGRRLASPWPGLVSLVLACTVCVAGLTYVAGLRHLEQTPRLLGWNWDAAVSIDNDADDRSAVVDEVGQVDGVEQATSGTLYPPVFLSTPGTDLQVWPWSFATGSDAVTPTMVDGRAPEGPDEVAIDIVFRDLTGLAPGDTVQLARPSLAETVADELAHNGVVVEPPEPRPVVATFEITGIAALPSERAQLFPQTSFTLAGLVAFAMPTAEELDATRALLPDDVPVEVRIEFDRRLSDDLDFTDRVVYVRATGDVQDVAARIDEVEGVSEVIAPTPLEVITRLSALNLEDTDTVPLTLAILSAVSALALVTYLLATGMWARRTELAVLRAMGMSSWGVRSSLAAQATSTVVLVLAVSVPIGIAIGQRAWLGYARDLLVVQEAAIPWTGIFALVVGALVAVNATAMLVAQLAVKRSASRELRAE